MVATVESTNQQTMYDLCLMAYGTLDLLEKFCSDNGIDDINYVPPVPQTFQYDTSLVTDQKTSNYSYSSTILINGNSCPLPTGVSLILAYTTAASFSWTITSGTYQYAVTLGSAAPVSWVDIDAFLGTILVEGLEDTTNYTFWLRNKCSSTSFSAITHIAFETADPPTCDIPTGLSLGASTDTTQVINWTPGAVGGRYKWVLNTTGVTPSTAISTGTEVSASSGVKNLTGLTSGTHYYFYLRSKCTLADSSAWALIEFDTLAVCAVPTGVSVHNLVTGTAQILWDATLPGVTYYLYVSTSNVPPANGSGTTHNGDLGAAGISFLTPSTNYYAFLQHDCGSGNFSTWVVTPFTSLP